MTEAPDELDLLMRKYAMNLSFSVLYGCYIATGLDHLHGFVWVEGMGLTPLTAARTVAALIEGT